MCFSKILLINNYIHLIDHESFCLGTVFNSLKFTFNFAENTNSESLIFSHKWLLQVLNDF